MNALRTYSYINTQLERISVEKSLFYSAFTCFSFSEILSATAFTTAYPILGTLCYGLLIVSAILLILRLIMLEITKCQWILVVLLGLLASVVVIVYGFQYPFWILFFIVSARGIDLKTLARITLVLAAFFVLACALACYVGVIENYKMYSAGSRAVRNSMGFAHPNRLGEYIAEVCIAYWYLRAGKRNGRVIALCIVSLLYVYYVANSRTSCIVFIAIILAVIFYPFLKRNPRFSILLCGSLATFVVLVSYFFMVAYDPGNSYMSALNGQLSGRLYFMNTSFTYAPPSLFGNDYSNAPVMAYTLATNSEYRFVVDNAYAHLVLLYGVAVTVLMFALIGLVYRHYYREQLFPIALLGLTILLVVGFVENFTLDVQYNYFLLLISNVIFLKKRSLISEQTKERQFSSDRLSKAMVGVWRQKPESPQDSNVIAIQR